MNAMGGERPEKATDPSARRSVFLRRPTWPCRLMALPFLGACGAVLGLVVLYHWPRVNVPVYYFTVRPALVWFCMVVPFGLTGLVAVRAPWFLGWCALWVVGLMASQEVLQALKPWKRSARARFRQVRSASGNPGHATGRLLVPLRVVSWNVMGGRLGAREGVEQLAALEPDIVLMQEWPGGRIGRPLKESDYFGEFNVAGAWQAIATRFPIQQVAVPELPKYRCEAWRVRVAPGADIICVNVHMAPLGIKTQVLRGWTVGRLRKVIRRTRRDLDGVRAVVRRFLREGPVILAGDFNLPPYYPDLRRATADLKECFAENGFGWGGTAPARMPVMRPDMIFAPRDARVYYAGAVPTRYSDHYMALAELEVPIPRTQAVQAMR